MSYVWSIVEWIPGVKRGNLFLTTCRVEGRKEKREISRISFLGSRNNLVF